MVTDEEFMPGLTPLHPRPCTDHSPGCLKKKICRLRCLFKGDLCNDRNKIKRNSEEDEDPHDQEEDGDHGNEPIGIL
jgi:hypothetical protein